METSFPPYPPTHLSYQFVHPPGLLPPPVDDTPEAPCSRNHAAIAKPAALRPGNANELPLTARCIDAKAKAEEMLRRLRRNADDIGLALRLNAQ